MKKLLSILGISLLAIAGSVTALVVSNTNKAQEAKATEYVRPRYSGLYERIENVSEVTPGTQVILATHAGYVFNGIGGNPAYAHADPGGVTMFGEDDTDVYYFDRDGTKFLWLDNVQAVVLTVEQGHSDYPGCVSFKGEFIVGSSEKYNEYLGENNDNKGSYESIAWFLDGFGMRPIKDGKSTWQLTYDSEHHKMLIKKVVPDDDTSYICYNYNGARHHFLFGGASGANVNLYRAVDMSKVDRPISVTGPENDPDKMTYQLGETIEYEGLRVRFRINRKDTDDDGIYDVYDDHYLSYDWRISHLFSQPLRVTDPDNVHFWVKIFNKVQYLFDITIDTNDSNNVYTQRDSNLPPDLRGTYLAVTENARVLRGTHPTETGTNYLDNRFDDSIFTNRQIVAESDGPYKPGTDVDQAAIKIVRTEINGSYYYHLQNFNDEYLCLGSQVDSADEYYIDYTSTPTASNAITISGSRIQMGDYYIDESAAKTKLICFTKSYMGMHLFKLSESTTSIANEVSGFVTYFEDQTKTLCEMVDEPDIDPDFPRFTDDLWLEIENEFMRLSPDAQGIFASTTYVHGTESLNTKENVVDRYDYILAKYNKKDFMCRQDASTYSNNYSNSSAILLFNSNPAAIIIIISSVMLLSSVACFVIIRKRKQQ